jgi:hypothetical protein
VAGVWAEPLNKENKMNFQEKVFQSLLRFHEDCDIAFKIINGVLVSKAIDSQGGVWVDAEISLNEHETFQDNFLDTMDDTFEQLVERRR